MDYIADSYFSGEVQVLSIHDWSWWNVMHHNKLVLVCTLVSLQIRRKKKYLFTKWNTKKSSRNSAQLRVEFHSYIFIFILYFYFLEENDWKLKACFIFKHNIAHIQADMINKRPDICISVFHFCVQQFYTVKIAILLIFHKGFAQYKNI